MRLRSFSVEKRVLQTLLVPVTILVENKEFAALGIFEAEIWVEHVDLPHERSFHLGAIDLLEASNVYDVALNFSEHSSFMEDDLFGVGQ